jgi:hypothetical protein
MIVDGHTFNLSPPQCSNASLMRAPFLHAAATPRCLLAFARRYRMRVTSDWKSGGKYRSVGQSPTSPMKDCRSKRGLWMSLALASFAMLVDVDLGDRAESSVKGAPATARSVGKPCRRHSRH